MMYSSQGQHLPCFKAGIKTIQDLEQRIDPPNMTNDKQLFDHTNKYIISQCIYFKALSTPLWITGGPDGMININIGPRGYSIEIYSMIV